MTLCIASGCRRDKENLIVLCADLKAGSWGARAEIGFKFRWEALNWPLLISGDMSRAAEIAKTFGAVLNGTKLNYINVLDAMKEAANIYREKLADEIVRRHLSVPYEYLKKNKSEFPESRVLETYTQISQMDSGAELIIAGFIDSEPFIFIMERDCAVSVRDNFACVGTGAYIAEPALYQRAQNRSLSLSRSLYHVYEAKRLGEIADGVGKYTVMMVISPQANGNLRYWDVPEDVMNVLKDKYLEYGLKPTFDFEWPEIEKKRDEAARGKVND